MSDEFGNEISSTPISMTADSSGKASATFAVPASKLGYYRVDAALPNGTALTGLGSRPAGFVTYAVVPKPLRASIMVMRVVALECRGGLAQLKAA